MAVAHRRAGKSVAFINDALARALDCDLPNPRFGYIAPLLSQAKSIAWDYLKHYARPTGATFNEAELRADLPKGARVRLFGADNPDALRGQYFDGVIFDEFGDMDPRVWTDVIRPALSDRNGWAAFAGTPRGKNKFYDLAQEAKAGKEGWRLWQLKASETQILTEEELLDAKSSMDEDAYAREYECSFDAAVQGAYYAREMADAETSKRICRIPIEPTEKVHTGWDLGIDDATAIWFFQDVGLERRFIDYFETSGVGLVEIVKRLEEKRYRYQRHILPHDAGNRQLSTGRSIKEQLESLKLAGELEIVPRTEDVGGDINLTRLMLMKCWFDSERCARGIEALKQYRREWDGKRQTWRERPLHDLHSHGADALRCIAASRKILKKQPTKLEIPKLGIV